MIDKDVGIQFTLKQFPSAMESNWFGILLTMCCCISIPSSVSLLFLNYGLEFCSALCFCGVPCVILCRLLWAALVESLAPSEGVVDVRKPKISGFLSLVALIRGQEDFPQLVASEMNLVLKAGPNSSIWVDKVLG